MHGVLILLHFPFNTLDSILDFFMEVLMPEITFFFFRQYLIFLILVFLFDLKSNFFFLL